MAAPDKIDETAEFRPRFDANGLMPAIAVEARTGDVLMLAYVNEEALRKTLATGEAHYWSRSRGELWHKGATSGHTQKIVEIAVDCDQDTLLYRVEQAGAACHTGRTSCFYRKLPTNSADVENSNDPMKLHFTSEQ